MLLVHLFIYFARVNFCRFSLHLGVRGWLRLAIVELPGLFYYRNDPKFSDRYAWANSADPDQTAPDQGLHCLLFLLHRLDALLYVRAT